MTYGDVIAVRLKQICDDKKITINKLATISGITQSTLDNIAKGNTKNPKLRTLHRLSVGLDMTVSEFLDFELMNTTIFNEE